MSNLHSSWTIYETFSGYLSYLARAPTPSVYSYATCPRYARSFNVPSSSAYPIQFIRFIPYTHQSHHSVTHNHPSHILPRWNQIRWTCHHRVSLFLFRHAIKLDVYEESEADLVSERNNNNRSSKSRSPDAFYANFTKNDRKFSSGYCSPSKSSPLSPHHFKQHSSNNENCFLLLSPFRLGRTIQSTLHAHAPFPVNIVHIRVLWCICSLILHVCVFLFMYLLHDQNQSVRTTRHICKSDPNRTTTNWFWWIFRNFSAYKKKKYDQK